MNDQGVDSEHGVQYKNPTDLWQREADADGSHEQWYRKAVDYWDKQEASYDGVLGGFGFVSDDDIRDSRAVLLKAMKAQMQEAAAGQRQLTAIDCGAGVGRVTEQLLLFHFNTVDLLEPSQPLLQEAQKKLTKCSSSSRYPAGHALGEVFNIGLEKFHPEPARYDCIWIQWCLLYLTDDDALQLLQRCKHGLKPDGIIMVKENICKQGFIVDKEDSSLTRSNAYMLELLRKADMKVLLNLKQRNFPKELFEVRMYVIRPRA